MELEEILDSLPICRQIAFRLCAHGEIVMEIVRALALQNMVELYHTSNPQLIMDCVGFLKRSKLIIVDTEWDKELEECVNEVKARGDRRVKDPVKYCLKHKRGTAINVVKPTNELCFLLEEYYKGKPFILSHPRFKK